ncbi:MAG: hypothetical protein QOI98_2976, partial [Solirubrobacteraceae bacterium]|nr:hypothetical protein [Solirubrobacteraceae bacterium]
ADGNKVASQVPVLPRCGVRSVSDVQAYEVTQIEHIATTAGCAAGWLRNGCHSAVGTGGTRVMTPFGPAAPTAWPHGQGAWTWIDCIVDHVSVTVIQSS